MKAKKFKRFRDFSAKLIRETGEEYIVEQLIDRYITHLRANGRGSMGTKGVPNALAAGQVLRWDERFVWNETKWFGEVGKAGCRVCVWYLKPEYL